MFLSNCENQNLLYLSNLPMYTFSLKAISLDILHVPEPKLSDDEQWLFSPVKRCCKME